MSRTVLITGSEGHLGRALRARFNSLGDTVIGLDVPGSGADMQIDLNYLVQDCDGFTADAYWDVVICNAKVPTYSGHEILARRARQAIINIGSIYGTLGSDPSLYQGTEVEPTPAWYAASKAALIGLTKWQATNLAPVRSNAVCPGGIFRAHSEEFTKRYTRKVPLARMATEEDVVNAVEWLASEKASYVTGQVLMVDGGLSCMA